VNISIPAYEESGSLFFKWDDAFKISVNHSTGEVCVSANSAGLISLARHLLTLAQESVPTGSHLHLTDGVELEEGSGDLIIEKSQ